MKLIIVIVVKVSNSLNKEYIILLMENWRQRNKAKKSHTDYYEEEQRGQNTRILGGI
jgi:hypothetical protein